MLPIELPVVEFVHEYDGDKEPSFKSLPVAEQVRRSVTVTDELGEIDTALIVGSVLITVAVAVEESELPEPSLTETVQTTESPTLAILGVRVREEELPTLVPLIVQS